MYVSWLFCEKEMCEWMDFVSMRFVHLTLSVSPSHKCRNLDSTGRIVLLCHQYLLFLMGGTHFLCLYIE